MVITLFPQAGVALGMCATAMQLGEEGNLIRNITLFAVLLYEIFGPLLTRWALTQSGDIKVIPDDVKNRRQRKLEQAHAEKAARIAKHEETAKKHFGKRKKNKI